MSISCEVTLRNCFTHSSLAYVSKGGPSKDIPISKKEFEVLYADGTHSHYTTREEAKRQTANNNAKWIGSKRLMLGPDKSKRSRWEVRGPRAFYSQGFGFGPKDGNLQLV